MAKITKRYCGGRKSPYQLTWCEQGSRHSRFFETERERDEFLRANDYLEKSSFQSLMKLDMDTISDIARIESMRGKITFREIWEFGNETIRQSAFLNCGTPATNICGICRLTQR